jgi:hypothetical protein
MTTVGHSERTWNDLLTKVKLLNELLWEGNCPEPQVSLWLNNFSGSVEDVDAERLHALHLATNVSYYGLREIRQLLQCMYRDHVRRQILWDLNLPAGPRSKSEVEQEFNADLARTYFLGMGNPAESGTHLLYYFRQENQLSKRRFLNEQQIFTSSVRDPKARFADPRLKRLIFLDDVCGSGQQSVQYSRGILSDIREVASRTGQDVECVYLVLFGATEGIEFARTYSAFDRVAAVSEMGVASKTYSPTSYAFRHCPTEVEMDRSRAIAQHYGAGLDVDHPLGYRDGELLLAFHHNVPDNTLPIIWFDEGGHPWNPLIRRAPKIY